MFKNSISHLIQLRLFEPTSECHLFSPFRTFGFLNFPLHDLLEAVEVLLRLLHRLPSSLIWNEGLSLIYWISTYKVSTVKKLSLNILKMLRLSHHVDIPLFTLSWHVEALWRCISLFFEILSKKHGPPGLVKTWDIPPFISNRLHLCWTIFYPARDFQVSIEISVSVSTVSKLPCLPRMVSANEYRTTRRGSMRGFFSPSRSTSASSSASSLSKSRSKLSTWMF